MKRGNFCQHFPPKTDGENLPATGAKSLNYFPSGLSTTVRSPGGFFWQSLSDCHLPGNQA
jgi:hypothetical protein